MDKIEQEQYTDDIKLAGESLKAMEQANLSYDANAVLGMAIGKLSRYEATGLTPQEIIDGELLTGWIPVEERLPEKMKDVLVQWESYYANLNETRVYIDKLHLNSIGRWTDGRAYIIGKSIAWMPLPEPYKGE